MHCTMSLLVLYLILAIKTCFVRANFAQGYFWCGIQLISYEFFKNIFAENIPEIHHMPIKNDLIIPVYHFGRKPVLSLL